MASPGRSKLPTLPSLPVTGNGPSAFYEVLTIALHLFNKVNTCTIWIQLIYCNLNVSIMSSKYTFNQLPVLLWCKCLLKAVFNVFQMLLFQKILYHFILSITMLLCSIYLPYHSGISSLLLLFLMSQFGNEVWRVGRKGRIKGKAFVGIWLS